MPLVECLLSVVYSMNAVTACLVAGGKVVPAEQLELQGRVERFRDGVVEGRPVHPMDWVTPALRHASTNRLPVLLTRLQPLGTENTEQVRE